MDANVRQLKSKLSTLLRRVQAGKAITPSVRKRPVARISPIARSGGSEQLLRVKGVVWMGGKPKGLPRGEVLPQGVSLSASVSEDRR